MNKTIDEIYKAIHFGIRCKKCHSINRPNPFTGGKDLTCPNCYPEVFKNR